MATREDVIVRFGGDAKGVNTTDAAICACNAVSCRTRDYSDRAQFIIAVCYCPRVIAYEPSAV